MASAHAGRLALIIVGAFLLAACEPGQELNIFGGGSPDTTVKEPPTNSVAGGVVIDVESPETFQVTDLGLWDGRPSLGGVWIAHPDVVEPERVMIRNTDNGNSIIGALFRRERENPGPSFQVSSDAAAELGMLAGAPSNLSVVALIRAVPEVAVAPALVVAPDLVVEPEMAEAIAAQIVAVIEAPQAAAAVPAEAEVPVVSIAAAAIEAATANNPTASLPAPENVTEAALEATATVAPVVIRPAAPLSALSKPFVQIGIYSLQSNADETSALLRSSGVIPTITTSQNDGKTYWRVIIGPIGNYSDRTAIIRKVKGLGFSDSYAVTN